MKSNLPEYKLKQNELILNNFTVIKLEDFKGFANKYPLATDRFYNFLREYNLAHNYFTKELVFQKSIFELFIEYMKLACVDYKMLKTIEKFDIDYKYEKHIVLSNNFLLNDSANYLYKIDKYLKFLEYHNNNFNNEY